MIFAVAINGPQPNPNHNPMKTSQLLARLSLLPIALPSVVFAQVINRPSNDRPGSVQESGGNTTYLVIGAVVVVALAAFFFFRSKGKS